MYVDIYMFCFFFWKSIVVYYMCIFLYTFVSIKFSLMYVNILYTFLSLLTLTGAYIYVYIYTYMYIYTLTNIHLHVCEWVCKRIWNFLISWDNGRFRIGYWKSKGTAIKPSSWYSIFGLWRAMEIRP